MHFIWHLCFNAARSASLIVEFEVHDLKISSFGNNVTVYVVKVMFK